VASLGSASSSEVDAASAAQTTTGIDGSFEIEGLTLGKYVLLATLEGYLFPLAQFTWNELNVDSRSPAEPARRRVLEVLPTVTIEPDQTSSLSLRLERGAEISGTVSYDDGSPVISAQITIYRFSAERKQWQEVQLQNDSWPQRETNDKGVYRIAGLPTGRYLVSVRIPPEGGSWTTILGGRLARDFGQGHPGRLEMYYGDTPRQKSATPVEVVSGERRPDIDIHFALSKLRTVSGIVVSDQTAI